MEKNVRFQASVFGIFSDIDLSQESMSKLYQIYLKENMMPAIMKEFDVISQTVKNRPNFVANDNSISISIASNRIDIVSDISAADKMYEKDRFITVAQRYLHEFLEIFTVGISRISYIEEGIIKTLNDAMDGTIRNQFLNSKHIYNCDKVFEWASNSVSLDKWNINGKTESVNMNVTTALRKMNAVSGGQPIVLNALVLTQDLNTVAENTSARFDYNDVVSFLHEARKKSEEIKLLTEG